MNIDDLLNKYFEGETSAEEERRLRAFFASANVPPRLAIYKPMFAYFDEEISKKHKKERKSEGREKGKRYVLRRSLYLVSGIAAAILLFIGIRQIYYVPDPCLCSYNYVMINGRCYTDFHTIQTAAFEALQEVATPAEEYFPERDNDISDREIIENQLRELSNIFSDDD